MCYQQVSQLLSACLKRKDLAITATWQRILSLILYWCCVRLFALKLTDGKNTAKAMEYKTLALPKGEPLPPGTKVLLSNATVKAGVILLDDKCFKASCFFIIDKDHSSKLSGTSPVSHKIT